MKITLAKFRKVLEDHGFLSMLDDSYKSCWKALKAAESEGTQDFIAHYCDRYKERYGFTPKIVGKSAGVAKRIVTELGLEDACRYADAYLKSSEWKFVDARHTLEKFEQSFLAIQQLLETGQTVTRAATQQADRAQANRQAIQAYRSKREARGSGEDA